MQDLFKFDIQMFSDGDTDSQAEQPDTSQETGEQPLFRTNPETGQMEVRTRQVEEVNSVLDDDTDDYQETDQDEEEEVSQKEGNESNQTEQEDDESPYDFDEEIVVKQKDGTEKAYTLRELLSGHMRQDDYTRKSQALAEQRRQLEERLKQLESGEAPKNNLASTPRLPNINKVDLANFNEVDEYVDNLAAERAKSKLGVQELIEVDRRHLGAYADCRVEIMQEIRDMQRKAETISSIEQSLRSKAPERFDDVWNFFQESRGELTLNENKKIDKILISANPLDVEKLFDEWDNKYCQKHILKTGKKPKPLKVVKEDKNIEETPTNKKPPNTKELQGMNSKEQAKWLMKHVLGKKGA